MMVSFIISIDTTYEMADNFFTLFFAHNFVQQSEVIIVVDGNYNLQIHNLLNEYKENASNVKVIYLPKVGYGKANNIGVQNSTGEYLFLSTLIFLLNKAVLKKCLIHYTVRLQTVYSHC